MLTDSELKAIREQINTCNTDQLNYWANQLLDTIEELKKENEELKINNRIYSPDCNFGLFKKVNAHD